MTESQGPQAEMNTRVEALSAAVEIVERRMPEASAVNAQQLVERVRGRLRHGTSHTVVALAGPTGAGKSTLFNALARAEVSNTGVRRPTTSSTHAAVWGADASDLLDWLEVDRRHRADDDSQLDGLVLLDLPDFDSTERTHQIEVDRLVELVDLLVWIVDPQKYADQSLHEQYLRPLRGHAEVMRFLLNKSDTIDDPSEVTADYERRLAEDGIAGAVVIAVSATDSHGVEQAEDLLRAIVSERRAATARLDADLKEVAAELGGSSPSVTEIVPKKGRSQLVDALGRAAGIDSAAEIVEQQYRRDAALSTGWPAVRWVRKLRKTPLRSLGTPAASAMANAEVGVALRDVAEIATAGMADSWARELRHEMRQAQPVVIESLGKVSLHAANATRDQPTWWSAFRWLQRFAAAAALIGALWLLGLAVGGGFFKLDIDPLMPMVKSWLPLPTLLVFAGLGAGILLALVARLPTAIGASRRGRRVRHELADRVVNIAERDVFARFDDAMSDHRELERLLAVVGGSTENSRR